MKKTEMYYKILHMRDTLRDYVATDIPFGKIFVGFFYFICRKK